MKKKILSLMLAFAASLGTMLSETVTETYVFAEQGIPAGAMNYVAEVDISQKYASVWRMTHMNAAYTEGRYLNDVWVMSSNRTFTIFSYNNINAVKFFYTSGRDQHKTTHQYTFSDLKSCSTVEWCPFDHGEYIYGTSGNSPQCTEIYLQKFEISYIDPISQKSPSKIGDYYYELRLFSGHNGNDVDVGNAEVSQSDSYVDIVEVAVPKTITSGTQSYNVIRIGDNAFANNNKLKNVNLPNTLLYIGKNAFYNCSGLTKITISKKVKRIDSNAFTGCDNIKEVNWEASNCEGYAWGNNVESFVIGNDVQNIPDYLCKGLTKLSSITIPTNVKYAGKQTFKECTNLTSVVWKAKDCSLSDTYSDAPFYTIRKQILDFKFGEKVSTIPSSLCYQMTQLSSIVIPSSVTSIKSYAFAGCTGLSRVYCYAQEPPVCAASGFNDVDKEHCILYVPKESVEAYKTADGWKEFMEIQPTETTSSTSAVLPYSEPFTSGIGDFGISNVNLGGLDYVWAWASANYGMKASAYVSTTNHVTESWLISPPISLRNAKDITLSFQHAVNKGTTSNLKVKISTVDNKTWSDLNIPNWPVGTNWTFVPTSLSLEEYAGSIVQIAFAYISTSSDCPTWEIKEFAVEGNPDTTYLKNAIIDAMAYYDAIKMNYSEVAAILLKAVQEAQSVIKKPNVSIQDLSQVDEKLMTAVADAERTIADIIMAADKAAFEEYKTSSENSCAGLAVSDDSQTCQQLIAKAQAAIAALSYDETKSLDENKALVDAIVTQLSVDLEAQRAKDAQLAADKAAFEEYKTSSENSCAGLAVSDDSQTCQQLIANAQAAIAALSYDETKSLDENKALVDAIVTQLKANLATQREKDHSTTGIDNVSDEVLTTRKLLINGVLHIEHNGHLFNAQGARVK